jgi:citronellyl-CoA synthetase
MLQDVSRTLGEAPVLLSLAKHLRPRPLDTTDSLGARVEQTAERFPDHTAIIFEGRTLTWTEFNTMSNRYAHALQAQGLGKGDAVSLFMENRVEFLACLVAAAKLGAITALINTNLSGRSLVHCVSITDSKLCVFGEERTEQIADIRDDDALHSLAYLFVADAGSTACPDWAQDLGAAAQQSDAHNPDSTARVTIGDRALYVFTSGTTGLPKAGVMTHRRFLISSAMASAGGLRCDEHDCIYLCLPLYHGTGLFLGAGAAFNTGAALFVRRRFSASAFLPEIREHGCTCFIYIGEICRYLLATPEQRDDYASPLTTVMGNGLRPDIWEAFKSRFGISRVSEFYGSSEGNIGFINLLNRDCTIGTTTLPHTVVRYDVDNDEVIRDAQGRCIKAERGEAGLLLGKITPHTQFEGYTSAEATESKILRDVYKAGDAWFNTGDLIRRIDVGFSLGLPHYQFVDRVGDTFRWKGENVSTNEVGEILNTHPQIHFCNVYGVEIPGTDGRAGMAALVLNEDCDQLDVDSLSTLVHAELPAYARPQFLRLLPAMDTTGTFKMLKGDLRKQGFDPDAVTDPLFVLKPGEQRYVPLDREYFDRIIAGEAGY